MERVTRYLVFIVQHVGPYGQEGQSFYGGIVFKTKQIIGVIHLLPLPGSPCESHSFEHVIERALFDAQALQKGGVELVIIENFGDAPFVRGCVDPHVVSMMTVIGMKIREMGLEVGVNVLRNDAQAAIAIASAIGASLIRVNVHTGAAWTDQGLIQGDAYQTLLYKKQLGVAAETIRIAADIMVKHATPAGTRNMLDAAKDTVYRGRADSIIVTGAATGAIIDIQELIDLRTALPDASILIGSGVNADNIVEIMKHADGAIVGTYFHTASDLSKPLDVNRVRTLMRLVESA